MDVIVNPRVLWDLECFKLCTSQCLVVEFNRNCWYLHLHRETDRERLELYIEVEMVHDSSIIEAIFWGVLIEIVMLLNDKPFAKTNYGGLLFGVKRVAAHRLALYLGI